MTTVGASAAGVEGPGTAMAVIDGKLPGRFQAPNKDSISTNTPFRNETLAFRIESVYGARHPTTKRICSVSYLPRPSRGDPHAIHRSRPPPLVGTRRVVVLAARDQRGQHDPQRGVADVAEGPGRERVGPAVDRRLLHAGLRNRPAHGRRAG